MGSQPRALCALWSAWVTPSHTQWSGPVSWRGWEPRPRDRQGLCHLRARRGSSSRQRSRADSAGPEDCARRQTGPAACRRRRRRGWGLGAARGHLGNPASVRLAAGATSWLEGGLARACGSSPVPEQSSLGSVSHHQQKSFQAAQEAALLGFFCTGSDSRRRPQFWCSGHRSVGPAANGEPALVWGSCLRLMGCSRHREDSTAFFAHERCGFWLGSVEEQADS